MAEEVAKENGEAIENVEVVAPAVQAEAPLTVILHQYPRTSAGPSPSLFALKLETYLRLAKITLENDFNKPASSKTGKTPWMTYGGQDVSDSSICIDFIKTQTGIDFNASLSNADKGVARAFQKMIEEELYWVLTLWRWVYDKEESLAKIINFGKLRGFFVTKFVRNSVKKSAHGHGIGRHTQADVMKIGENDIQAIGDFLGEKKYLMGDSITEVDCSLFGLFAQFLYVSPTCPLTSFIKEKYQNLVDYCDRIKAEYWGDWEQICETVKSEKEAKNIKSEKHGKKSLQKSDSTAENTTATVVNGNGTVNGHSDKLPEISEEHAVAHPTQNGHAETTVTSAVVVAAPEVVCEEKLIAKAISIINAEAEVTSSVNGEDSERVLIKENGGGMHGDVAIPAV